MKKILSFCFAFLSLQAIAQTTATIYVGGDKNVYAIDAQTGAKKWAFLTSNAVVSSPTVADGVVYVGSDDRNVYALDAQTGAKKWSFLTDFDVFSSPTVVNGVVYVGSYDGKLYALDTKTGTKKWSFVTGFGVLSSPTVLNGVVYVGSDDNNVYALDAVTGAKKWSFLTGGVTSFSSPTVVNGVVYVGSHDKNLYALDAVTGTKKWSFVTSDYVFSSPTVVNGIVYVGSGDDNLYALDAVTGAKKWNFKTGGDIQSSPMVVNGVVYVGSNDNNVYALDAVTGAKKWSFLTSGYVFSSPTIANGVVYVGSRDKNLYALDAVTGTKKWSFASEWSIDSSPCVVGVDGISIHSSISGAENPNISKNTLRPNPENIILSGAAQKSQTALTTNNNWTAKSNADWLVLDNVSGTAGTANVSFSVTANAGQKRSTTITFTAGDLTWLAFVEQNPSIYISANSRLIDGREQTYKDLMLNSLGTWTASTTATWLSISPASGTSANNQAISLQATANSTGTNRTADVVFTSNGISQTFKLTQQPAGTVVGETIYVGSHDKNIYALDAQTGVKKWNFLTGNGVLSSPTIVNGVVYVGSHDKNLYALDAATGIKKWVFSAESVVVSNPTVVNGVVYVGSGDYNLYAIDATTGTKKWSFKTGYIVRSSPTVVNGVVYVGSGDNNLYALDAVSGAKKWNFATGGAIWSSPTVVNGIVYVGSDDGYLYAIDATTGIKRWTFFTMGNVQSSPTVVNGVVYIGSNDGNLYAIDTQTGAKKWSYKINYDSIISSPTVANDIVYVGSNDNNLYAIDTKTGAKKWSFATGYDINSSPVVLNDVLYTKNHDGYIYALDATNGAKKWVYMEFGSASYTLTSSPCVVGSDGKTYHSSISGTENENISKNTLRPNPENIVLNGAAQKSQTLLTSNTNWAAKSNADWLVLETTSGTAGTANIAFSVSANSVLKRSTTITFTAGDLTWLAFVEQSAAIYTSASTALIDGREQAYKDLTLNSIATWTATTTATWLSISPASGTNATNQVITLQATANNTGATRTADVVFTSNGISQTFKLTQQQAGTVVANTLYIGSPDKNIYAIDATTGVKKWAFLTGGEVKSSPTVANGVVYVGSDDKNLYALDANTGAKKWSFLANNTKISSSPMIANGIVYVGTYASYYSSLYAIDANTGTQKWSFAIDSFGWIVSSPTVVNGVVYVVHDSGNLYAIDAKTGTQKWSFRTSHNDSSSPTVVNGVVYVGSNDGYLYALDATTGTKKWSFATPSPSNYSINSSPTIFNGSVYVGSNDGNIYALDAITGIKKWSFKTGIHIGSSPMVVNGVVYVGSWDSNLYALDAQTGTKKWSFKTGGTVDSSPTVLNGIVYVGSDDGNVYAIDAATGTKKWSFASEGKIYSSPCVVGSDGKTYHSSISGYDDAQAPTLLLDKTIDNISGNAQTINNAITASAAWTATTDATWLKINVPSGTATQSLPITFTVDANTGISRTAVVTFKADGLTKTLSIIQGAIPSLSLSTSSQSVAYTASTATTTITTNYDWTSAADVTWLKVTPATGVASNDKQNVSIAVEANPNPTARTGKVTFSAGGLTQVFTITQALAPVLTLSANSQNIAGTAGNATVTLTTNNTWTATSDATWLKVPASGSAGNNQSINITADANQTTAARVGKITFTAGGLTQTLTVNQAFAPYLGLSANATNTSNEASTQNISLNANVAWTATSDAAWLKINVASGSIGTNQALVVSAEANTGSAERVGKITFKADGATQTYTLTQAALLAKEADLLESVGVYPNPSASVANLEVDSPKEQKMKLLLLNVSGQQIGASEHQLQAGKQTIQVSVSDVPTGQYLIHLSFENGKKATKKIMVIK